MSDVQQIGLSEFGVNKKKKKSINEPNSPVSTVQRWNGGWRMFSSLDDLTHSVILLLLEPSTKYDCQPSTVHSSTTTVYLKQVTFY